MSGLSGLSVYAGKARLKCIRTCSLSISSCNTSGDSLLRSSSVMVSKPWLWSWSLAIELSVAGLFFRERKLDQLSKLSLSRDDLADSCDN